MGEVILRFWGRIIIFILEGIFVALFEGLFHKIGERLDFYSDKDEEIVLGRIYVLSTHPWFEPYKKYEIELSKRKRIRKLILKINMNEIISNEEKRFEFLNELNRLIFDLNGTSRQIRKTSQL